MRCVVISLLLVTGCASYPPANRFGAGVDHILIGAPSLDAGIAAFESATGVSPVRGGRHPSRGTENALASLGHLTYVEIIAPRADASDTDEMVRHLRQLQKPAIVGWAVHIADTAAAIESFQRENIRVSKAQPGSRITPEGKKLEWVTFNLEEPAIPTAPFFISWSPDTVHPSLTSPPCSLRTFQVDDPRARELSRVLNAIGVPVEVHQAERPHLRLDMRCGTREATFESE